MTTPVLSKAQLNRARKRFPALVQLLQHSGHARGLVAACVAANQMVVSRWARELRAPTDADIVAIVGYFEWYPRLETSGLLSKYLSPNEKIWAEATSQPSNLADLRRSRGLRQVDVARVLKVSRYTYLLAEKNGGQLAERARVYLLKIPVRSSVVQRKKS